MSVGILPVQASRETLTQAQRSARSRDALLEAAARGLSRHGYSNLNLSDVASDAGYTRGALYHQFEDKEDLALAVLHWANETWQREVGEPARQESDPLGALLAMARGHAVLCRKDVARVAMALRVEFSNRDHPLAHEIDRIQTGLVKRLARLITAGRRADTIPPGPPAGVVALALVGALEGVVVMTSGRAPHDERLAVQAVTGVLGLAGGAQCSSRARDLRR